MFGKLFLGYLLLLVLALGVFGFVSARSTRSRMLEEIELRLRTRAETLRPLVRSGLAREELRRTVRDLGSEDRITVIASDGKVLAESHADPDVMEPHNDRPEVGEARSRGRGRNIRYSATVRYDMMYYAVLLDPEQPRGIVLRCALPLTKVNEEVGAVTRTFLYAFAIVAVLGAGVVFGFTRRITAPLRQIRAVAEAVSAGNFDTRVPTGSGELGSVAAAMNRMAEELSGRLQSLASETSKLQAVISSMQEGVIAVDGQGNVVHHNEAARQLLDLRQDPSGLKVWEIARFPGLAAEVQGGATVRRMIEVGPRVVGLCISPVGGLGGAVIVAHDATEGRRYDSLRREFVANVSHELRTPLSLIRGYVETLREGAWKDGQRAPEFLEIIEKQVARLSAIVEDLLQLSRLESAGQIVTPTRIELGPFLERLREQFRSLAERKAQLLEIAVEAAEVTADPELLDRAVANLVDNAIKYTQEKGTIRLLAQSEQGTVAILVKDDGPGIPEADQERIFERFYRVDKSRSRELGGTGLGLAIVKHIAQLHGGSVTVRSRPGEGSEFRLTLPAP